MKGHFMVIGLLDGDGLLYGGVFEECWTVTSWVNIEDGSWLGELIAIPLSLSSMLSVRRPFPFIPSANPQSICLVVVAVVPPLVHVLQLVPCSRVRTINCGFLTVFLTSSCFRILLIQLQSRWSRNSVADTQLIRSCSQFVHVVFLQLHRLVRWCWHSTLSALLRCCRCYQVSITIGSRLIPLDRLTVLLQSKCRSPF